MSQDKGNKMNAVLFDYCHQFPLADLKEDFGDNSSLSFSFIHRNKHNWFYGIDGAYIFGDNIKDENLFDNISTANGEIINKDGLFANVLTYERGFSSFLYSGKAYPFYKDNETGLYISIGVGYIEHRIRIQTQEDIIPHLNEEYKKGYDRLTGGVSAKMNVNYMYFSKKNNIKIYFGIELIKGWTSHLRSYNFNTRSYNSDNIRNDIIIGIKTGFIIPIFKRNDSEFHYK